MKQSKNNTASPKLAPKSPLLPTFSLSIHKDLVGGKGDRKATLQKDYQNGQNARPV